jgi:hypothetical protein
MGSDSARRWQDGAAARRSGSGTGIVHGRDGASRPGRSESEGWKRQSGEERTAARCARSAAGDDGGGGDTMGVCLGECRRKRALWGGGGADGMPAPGDGLTARRRRSYC